MNQTRITSQCRQGVERLAGLFVKQLHSGGQVESQLLNHMPTMTDEPISHLVLQATPNRGGPSGHFLASEWRFVISARVGRNTPHLVLKTFDSGAVQRIQWQCGCDERRPPYSLCPHIGRLAFDALGKAMRNQLPLDQIVFGTAAPEPAKPTAVVASERSTGPSLTQAVLEGYVQGWALPAAASIGRVGLCVAPLRGTGPRVLAFLPCVLAKPDKRRKKPVCPELLPELHLRGAATTGIDAEEALARQKILALSCPDIRSDARAIRYASDVQLLHTLCNDGRVVDPQGAPFTWSDELIARCFRWRPVTPTSQRIEVELPVEIAFVQQGLGLLVDFNARVFSDLGMNQELLKAMGRWPALNMRYQQGVTDFWKQDPVLSRMPAPPAMEDRPIREVQATWHAKVEVVANAYNTSFHNLRIVLVARAEGRELPAEHDATALIEGVNEWIATKLDFDPIQRSKSRLAAIGLNQRNNAREWTRENQYGVASLNTAASIRLALDPRIAIEWDGLPPAKVIAPYFQVAEIVDGIAMRPIPGKPDHLQVDIAPTVGGHRIDLEIFADPNTMYGNDSPAGTEAMLEQAGLRNTANIRRITKDTFACTDNVAWIRMSRRIRELADAATRKGNALTIRRGRLLSLWREHPEMFNDLPDILAARELSERMLAAKQLPGPTLPEGLKDLEFEPFQGTAVTWLLTLREAGFGGVLADDRGLGKTLECLGTIGELRARRRAQGAEHRPCLVVIERKEKVGWTREIHKHVSDLAIHWEHGTTRCGDVATMAQADVVITTYNHLISEPGNFVALDPEFVFLDEAKAIKNPASVRFGTAALFERASIIPVTGTPVDRNFNDLWSMVELAVPGLLGSERKFRARYTALIGRTDPEARRELATIRESIAPFVRRQMKPVPGQKAQKSNVVQVIDLLSQSAAIYNGLREREEAEKNAIFDALAFHKAVIKLKSPIDRLRLWCARVGTKQKPTEKGDYLIHLVKDRLDAGHRILVFTHHNAIVPSIKELFDSSGIANAVYAGSDANRRDKELALFKDGHVDVMILSDLGSAGLDLPESSVVIITDPWVNLATDDQMGDRAHRLISKDDVTVYKLALAGTIEDVACDLIGRNRQSSEALFEESDQPLTTVALSREDYDRMFATRPERSD